MTADELRSVEDLRGILLDLPPSGAAGFEGLVASCLAALTGRTFRLAKSGLQFGRDASTPPDPFAIAMEAKRYQNSMTLEDLAGKAVVFASMMGREIDVWVLAVTSEVGESVVRHLHAILEKHGVELLTLDWSPSGLPALAVLLATQHERTISWFALNAPLVERTRLELALATVARAPDFPEQRDRLSERLEAPHVGLSALANAASFWLHARFRDPKICQRTFGQFVSVANPTHPAQPRERTVAALEAAMGHLPANRVILVHGEEGVGKTWVVAQWWCARPNPPILLFVSGRRVELLDTHDPMGGLARLLTDQHPSIDHEGWKRRLARWRSGGFETALRFVLVLDGVNEHPRREWPEVIRAYVPIIGELGGAVVVTSRTGYWEREMAPRLHGSVAVEEILVGGYSDLELAIELASVGATADDLPAHVRRFVRNPRVCSVAKSLLSALVIQAGDLTIERLLLEYWRSRLAERGSLARHNIVDFDNLLRAHAQEWLKQGTREFDRDSWATYSGAARRMGQESVLEDLTEIEEGRFLTITSETDNSYAFRADALPYAVGLLIGAELREVARDAPDSKDAAVDEALARMLDPVRGFDRISDVVAAAIGIAGWDRSMPVEVFRALIRGWCSLQNTTDESDASALRHVVTRPDAVLDVVEQPGSALPGGFRSGTITRLLLKVRDVPAFATALGRRIPKWLSVWSLEDEFKPVGEGADRRRAERDERIRSRLAALTEAERSYLRSATLELSTPPEIGLQYLSALLLARRPLAAYASGIVAWGFAQALAGSIRDGREELAWVFRLNRLDPLETAEAIQRMLAGFDLEPPITRHAVANVLRLLGDADSTRRADELYPRRAGESWNLRQEFSNVDPRDPNAPPPTDLSRARKAVANLRPEEAWVSMGQTSEGMELEYATAPLARFEPDTLLSALRAVVVTVRSRSELPLRQLAFRLPSLSVILEGESLQSVRERLDTLLVRPEDASPDDLHWILLNLATTLLPHLSATEQTELLQAMPSEMPVYDAFGDGLVPIDADSLEQYLGDALSRDDDRGLLWLLFHASLVGPEPTERVRAEVVRLFMRGDDLLGMIAASYVSRHKDRDLDNAIIAECMQSTCPSSRYHRRALAQVIVRGSRMDAVHLVHYEFIPYVAHGLGGDALLLFREYIDRTVEKALDRAEPTGGEGVELQMDTSEDGLEMSWWGNERREQDVDEAARDFASAEGIRRWNERQQQLRQAIEAFQRELVTADAEYLAWAPPLLPAFMALASEVPDQLHEWLTRILKTNDPKRLSQIRNWGLVMASACGYSSSPLAADVFRKLASVSSVWNARIGELDLYTYALFSAGDGAEIDTLRREFFEQAEDDKTIAAITVAAEWRAPDWLERYTRSLLQSPTLADYALGITIEGFRTRCSHPEVLSLQGEVNGFLRVVIEAAGAASQCSEWCAHWLRCAQTAENPIDFWRFTLLAQGTIDSRNVPKATTALTEGAWARFGEPILRDLTKAAEKIADKRERTLFGVRAPSSELRVVLFRS